MKPTQKMIEAGARVIDRDADVVMSETLALDVYNAMQQRSRGCERKKWFRTQAQAERSIVNMVEYTYHCKFCDGWHLATKK